MMAQYFPLAMLFSFIKELFNHFVIEMNFCFTYSLLKGMYLPSFHVCLIGSELQGKLVFNKTTTHNSLVRGSTG